MSPKKPSTQRQKQKIVDLTQVESDIPKHSDNLPKSKKLQIVNKAKSKENINSDLETNEADNLQSKVQIESYQPNYPPSIELQNQQTYIKNQQNQINELLNHYESNESSLFAADNDLSNHDIEGFIASAVWEKLLKKYIDILDYDIFIKQQSGVKVLVKLVARSLKIYVEYLIAKSKGENSDYAFMVLNHIKELDNITIDIGFLAATNNDTQSNNNTQSDNDTQADNNTQANYNIQVENNQQSYNNN
ncbi:27169_t:CDS:2 [Racocetra persica]|uniref:27169_t:CDS:1 n=1 Tax=Racocetra persica TaxID=160502 RepID=A0ACA9KH09_9GLOM|nr:27169_t:CDS:2 [Racocetra persica]